ncbi:MAG: hypothetical protein ACSLEM_01550 [Candidatus Malihini olakiniferum]
MVGGRERRPGRVSLAYYFGAFCIDYGHYFGASQCGKPTPRRVLSMLPAMLLYLIFLLQSSLRSNASKEKIDPMNPIVWIWLTNLAYIGVALLFNIWDSVLLHRLRARVKVQGAA